MKRFFVYLLSPWSPDPDAETFLRIRHRRIYGYGTAADPSDESGSMPTLPNFQLCQHSRLRRAGRFHQRPESHLCTGSGGRQGQARQLMIGRWKEHGVRSRSSAIPDALLPGLSVRREDRSLYRFADTRVRKSHISTGDMGPGYQDHDNSHDNGGQHSPDGCAQRASTPTRLRQKSPSAQKKMGHKTNSPDQACPSSDTRTDHRGLGTANRPASRVQEENDQIPGIPGRANRTG
ncbi:MAG: hypothetical protein Ct9H300mP1_12980 [Planctomycetaceae bacterium]|nr:MAG: hypothetical protein Ct9H300mP1_12980 [Planctomycetaceae bacterium]